MPFDPATMALAIQTAGDVADLIGQFKGILPDNRGAEKTAATISQRNIEKVAMDIQRAVNEGRLDHDSALQVLQFLAVTLSGPQFQGTPELVAGARTASLIVGQVIADIQSKRQVQVSAPFRNAEGRLNNLTGTDAFRGERLRTGVQNLSLGTPLGKQLEGTPIGDLFNTARQRTQGNPNVAEDLTGAINRLRQISPTPTSNIGGGVERLRDFKRPRFR